MKKDRKLFLSTTGKLVTKLTSINTTIVCNLYIFALYVLAISCFLLPVEASATSYYIQPQQSPTSLTVTNATKQKVYANLILGQPPTSLPPKCSNLGKQITSIKDTNLKFKSSKGKLVTFSGPPNVTTKGAYQMDANETITYIPQTFTCFGDHKCTPAISANFFFTKGFNGTTTGNNGCGGKDTTYPNATNLAELSLNFSANSAVGTQCANADDTDISLVNGVNATLQINTRDAGNGQAWPAATSIAENKKLGKNANQPGVFGWAATTCTGTQGFPNPSKICAPPHNAPKAVAGACTPPNSLISGPKGTQYCAETSASGTCNNQRAAFNTGGTVKITFKGLIPAYVDEPAGFIFDNAAAQSICPKVCTSAKGTWSKQWTNIVTPSVCGCLIP